MWFDTAIAAIGFILALFIGLRSRKETRHHTLKENIAPGNAIFFSGYADLTDK